MKGPLVAPMRRRYSVLSANRVLTLILIAVCALSACGGQYETTGAIGSSWLQVQFVYPEEVNPGNSLSIYMMDMSAEQVTQTLGAKTANVTFSAAPVAGVTVSADGDIAPLEKSVVVRVLVPATLPPGDYFVRAKIGDQTAGYSRSIKILHWWSWTNIKSWVLIILALFFLVSAPVFVTLGIQRWIRKRRQPSAKYADALLKASQPVAMAEPVPSSIQPELAIPFPVPPKTLQQEILNGECVLVLGPGLRTEAGLPPWAFVLKDIVQDLASSLEQSDALTQLQREGRLDDVVDFLETSHPGSVATRLAGMLMVEPVSANIPLVTLSVPPFSGVVSLMVDRVDSLIWSNTTADSIYLHEQAEKCLDALSREQFFILKLNGSITSPSTMLLSHQALLDVLARNAALRDLLKRIYYARTLLFVGFTIDSLQAFLRAIERYSDSTRSHIALVPSEGPAFDPILHNIRRQFGVEVAKYSASEPNPVSTYIGGISTVITGSFAHGPLLSKLTRVELRDIGPFVQCDLDIDHRWTVLLGDNGVGKSTVLRAIAVAFCGTTTENFADRLLKSGAPSGSITLYIANRRFVTTISRKSGGGFTVESPAGIPVEQLGLLCIGYSALRTVTALRTETTSVQAGRATAMDLAPLTSDQLDTRIEGVKGWIARVDHLRNSDASSPDDRQRYDALFREVFDMFGAIATGVNIRPSGVNPKTGEIRIVSDDGEISFESLSQGTLSLIAWTGSLMQRLFETAPTGDNPMKCPAIVLIDEIDAHMHPAWQQTLVSRLSALFENVQFIATSHSPLLVGGLEPSQVFRFRRNTSGQVEAEQSTMSLKGQGAAGLLTSPLFGLASQLDVETANALDRKRQLSAKQLKGIISADEERELQSLSETVSQVDFSTHVRDPLYSKFVNAMAVARSEGVPSSPAVPTPEERERSTALALEIAREIKAEELGSSKGI